MREDAMVKKRSRKVYTAEDITSETLEDILWKERYKASREETIKQSEKRRKEIEEKQQYYVDNLSSIGDKRSISVIANEQAEHYWRSAPQMHSYRKELQRTENIWIWICGIGMSFWLSIALYFLFWTDLGF